MIDHDYISSVNIIIFFISGLFTYFCYNIECILDEVLGKHKRSIFKYLIQILSFISIIIFLISLFTVIGTAMIVLLEKLDGFKLAEETRDIVIMGSWILTVLTVISGLVKQYLRWKKR